MENTKKFADLKIGDIIWVTKTRWRSSDEEAIEEAIVTKVGRKYISIKSTGKYKLELGRFEIDTGVENVEYGDKRRIVRSQEAYHAENTRQRVFSELSRHFNGYSNRLHAEVTTEDIIAATKLLKIELKL